MDYYNDEEKIRVERGYEAFQRWCKEEGMDFDTFAKYYWNDRINYKKALGWVDLPSFMCKWLEESSENDSIGNR